MGASETAVSLEIHLVGRPHLVRPAGKVYRFRSRKSCAVLAYLLLSERAPTRSQLASILFADADDPARALRWSLTEIPRGLGDDGCRRSWKSARRRSWNCPLVAIKTAHWWP
jgi:DNA-binding SARP family transcriptional activator